ncbi:beta-ketoacyl-[acyl-carrier-protein] synthase family protein [Ramlibacter montanisoli]|uniref:Beta-ketoacyl-[acyl-carrier-protein] synthase family protein n=1 Tax=Ramlibacter montanisoli TaxID=2732512 RepID=A0A849KF26_9BURK|nr:beta-ketoacyl-[acyl-carrier-protein] synthase family protein [Ramlibacter montanisoli]NNU42803.1 beta-ketoacyl-[acyl-carrier-protein] synthase family protein [Ramlibacter montanisoli]
MNPLPITHATLTTALGAGMDAHLQALQAQRCGLTPCSFDDVELPGWIGRAAGLEDVELPVPLREYDCRNNRLAWLALQQDGFLAAVQAARARWGAHRVAVLLGTSTSGILETERAYAHRDAAGALPADFRYAKTHSTASLARFVAEATGVTGPTWVVSTACSSSAKVFGDAARLIEAGWIDAAVVGGVDSLCLTTLYGFHSLQLFSPDLCRPWDAQRSGVSLGEGAAFALLQREPVAGEAPLACLLGVGESSDAHHMSSPHPEGELAAAAMRQALAGAGLAPTQIDYINLHGTGTPSNDAAEDRAVQTVFGTEVPCSSTKGATGHTLGAAGGVEAVISLLALRHGLMPGGINVRQRDPALGANYLQANRVQPVRHVLTNSFGFGGSNASLVLGAP